MTQILDNKNCFIEYRFAWQIFVVLIVNDFGLFRIKLQYLKIGFELIYLHNVWGQLCIKCVNVIIAWNVNIILEKRLKATFKILYSIQWHSELDNTQNIFIDIIGRLGKDINLIHRVTAKRGYTSITSNLFGHFSSLLVTTSAIKAIPPYVYG